MKYWWTVIKLKVLGVKMWWVKLTQLENWFDYEMFDNGGWKWVGGVVIGASVVFVMLWR